MPDDKSSPQPVVPSWLEIATKYVPVVTGICFLSAFIYDSVFWWLVDSRVLSLFVLSDHIETAVNVMTGFLITAMLGVGNFYYLPRRFPVMRRNPRRVLVATLATSIVFLIVFALPPGPRLHQMAVVALVSTLLVVVLSSAGVRARSFIPILLTLKDSYARPVSMMAIWTMIVVGTAFVQTVFVHAPQTVLRDRVEIGDGRYIDGTIIRVLDKGVVMLVGDYPDLRFIPKEQVRRITFKPEIRCQLVLGPCKD